MCEIRNILTLMEAPLHFLSGNSFKNLELVKDFESSIKGFLFKLSVIENAYPDNSASFTQIRSVRKRMEKMFKGFDAADRETKKSCLISALHCLEELHALAGAEKCTAAEKNNDNGRTCEISFNRLAQPVQYVKGIGPRIAALFAKKGINTVEDLLYFMPHRYEDRRKIVPIADAAVGSVETILGMAVNSSLKRYRSKSVFEVTFNDDSGIITAKWFRGNAAFLRRMFKTGEQFFLTGEIKGSLFGKDIIHPDFERLDSEGDNSLHVKRIVPVYSEMAGLSQKQVRRIIMKALDEYAQDLVSPLPSEICRKMNFPDTAKALRHVHFPDSNADIQSLNLRRSDAHRRMIFDEFFFFELALAMKKRGIIMGKGNSFRTDSPLVRKFYTMLPFELTDAQKRVIEEILADMRRDCPMHRLLQGDVGSGKTVVSMVPIIVASVNSYQSAIMAPTEILAQQHYHTIGEWAEKLGITAALLSGAKKAAERKEVLEKIKNGKVDVVIGTHSLVQEGVVFKNLGFVVIDEQHRFGVLQRAALREKGKKPDVLVMTATPIPRTLAMTVYGDLDVSVIEEMPPAKLPVRTKLYLENKMILVYDAIRREVRKGNRVFIVYPLAEESEILDLKDATTMATHLRNDIFPDFRIGMVHGRMKGSEKDKIMGEFREGTIDILVSTTVIEVGIDIPSASLMVIEHAERFGLSQLHQLRGRVGRGRQPSSCILIAHNLGSRDAKRRLQIMEKTENGFEIAEEDLAIRGPGEFLGTRQAGIPDFRVANIVRDGVFLDHARKEAFSLCMKDPDLAKPENELIRDVLMRRWKDRLELAKTG
ncbi:MAG: ATP-dependent DNA helicase RecG [Syntrophales bacterium]|jgi:ATP-dependent DNA helicase RecG|nr:ATP-dependent DNA helicase RecG [Syntrophales bacterium]MDY0044164.1 ATP-dependent DNA helicase RecG [Syntrophales bacterium]